MEEQQRRAEEQIRSQFLSDIGRIPAGRSEGTRRREFHNDLRSFGEQIVGVWSLRLAPMSNERVLEDLEDRSGDLARTVERMREYVDRDSDPPEFDPAPLTGRDLAERLDHFLVLGLQLRRGAIEVTGGEVLDFGRLNEVRADFATLESWIAEFRESAPDHQR